MASLPRNVVQSEVNIHAICDKLICCKTGWNVVVKLHHIAFNTFCSNVPELVARFTVTLGSKRKDRCNPVPRVLYYSSLRSEWERTLETKLWQMARDFTSLSCMIFSSFPTLSAESRTFGLGFQRLAISHKLTLCSFMQKSGFARKNSVLCLKATKCVSAAYKGKCKILKRGRFWN